MNYSLLLFRGAACTGTQVLLNIPNICSALYSIPVPPYQTFCIALKAIANLQGSKPELHPPNLRVVTTFLF
jgi:hypothetical protein